MKHRLLAMLLALALVCAILPAAVLTASADIVLPPDPFDDIVSGSCGDLAWELNKTTRVLTITGTGAMTEAPWLAYSSSIRTVVIGEGVTTVGYGAFQLCTRLAVCTIPDSVTYIDYNAFAGCTGLTAITIPDGVTAIGGGAFTGCSGLTELTILGSVTRIGDNAFRDCTALTKVTLEEGVETVGLYAFGGCAKLKEVSIPESMTEIGGNAFADCTSLTDVYYGGIEAKWNKLTIGDGNECLTDANVHCVECTHKNTRDEHENATCTAAGYDRTICDDCGAVISETVLPALGHDLIVDADKPATCTEAGLTGGSHCSRCDYKVEQKVVPALGHDWDNGKVTTPATATKEGVKTFTCNRCGETRTEVIPATGGGELKNPFVDVGKTDYFYDAVLWAYYHDPQVTNGLDATHFGPYATCTRGQIVTFLWRALGEPAPTITKSPFVDVKESDYYYKAVLWAYEKGVTTGTDATHFAPNAFCKREHAVAFLYRAAGKPAYTNKDNPFVDVSSSAYYYDAVLWAVEKNVTKGMDATHFGSANSCQRCQIVTFLYRFMNP